MKILKFKLVFVFFAIYISNYAQTRIACVGNSITYGSGIVGRDSLSYPVQLQKMLGVKYEVKNFGVSGATMLKKGNKPYWKETAFSNALAFNPEIVIIKLGTNDSKWFNWKYSNEYPIDYKAMIDTFKNLSSKPKIYICLPVPVVENRWSISKDTVHNQVLPLVKQIAKDNNVDLIDLFTPFMGKYELLPDKIHPDARGAKLMAEIIYGILVKKE